MIVSKDFLTELLAFVSSTRLRHAHCDDSWYCCRACRCEDHQLAPGEHLGQGYADREGTNPGVCTCGADEHNAKVAHWEEELRKRIAHT